MRLFTLSLLMLFSLQVLDVPPMRNVPNPKTCCGRPVCLCTHPKGTPCPFKKAGLNTETHPRHGFCHLKNKQKFEGLPQDNTYVPRAESKPVAGTFFKQAPCHSDEPKSSLPTHAKEFYLNPSSGNGVLEKPDFFFVTASHFPAFIFDRRLDRPPRALPHTVSFSF